MRFDPNRPIFDPGLQPERTELAWRRTAMSIGVGALVAMRLLPAIFGHALWAAVGAAGVVYAGVLWVSARRRFTAVYVALTSPDTAHAPRLPGALPFLLMAGGVFAMGIGGLVVLAALTLQR